MNPFVEEIVDRAAAAGGLDPSTVRELLAVPPEESMGDYALPCFALAKELRRNPAQIAAEIAARIEPETGSGGRIASVAAAGPYVNFTLDRPAFIGHTLDEIAARGRGYGSRGQGAGRTLALDFSSPNLARPFSIAHLRSTPSATPSTASTSSSAGAASASTTSATTAPTSASCWRRTPPGATTSASAPIRSGSWSPSTCASTARPWITRSCGTGPGTACAGWPTTTRR